MAEFLAKLPLTNLGVGAIIVAFALAMAWLVLKGELVAKQQLLDARADRDYWRAAHDTQQKIALQQGVTLERMLVQGETMLQVLHAIRAHAFHEENVPP